jgi:phage-related protein
MDMALIDTSLRFNGLTRHAKLNTASSIKNLSNFTWMAWCKVGSNPSQYQRAYVERQGTGTGIRFALTPYNGRLRFEFSPKDGTTDTNYDYRYTWDDYWHHVAFVARISGASPTYEMFLDGSQVAEGKLIVPAGTTAISNTTPLGGSIYIGNASFHTSGGDVFATDRYWDGKLSEIITFNTAKNESDILAYFASNNTYSTSDPETISYWRLDDGTGEGTGPTSFTNLENGAWTGSIYNLGTLTADSWTLDRPFLGDGTIDSTAPSVPTLPATPTTNITADGFTADWNDSTDNVYVQNYELNVAEVSDFSSFTNYIMGRTTVKTVTGLLAGVNYYWRVRARDAENNSSAYTATQSLTTLGSGDLTAPLPPTALSASQITHASFRVSWTASASSDETGYKLDVSTDPFFTTYLVDHRNRDVGNVVFFDVFGTQPLSTYFVRLRAYDAAQNESVESVTLVVTTPTRPDVTPPLIVELLPPTAISHDAFTANWNEGQDDVGISHYHIDVAYDDAFTMPLVIAGTTYTDLNVGAVESYRIENLPPETSLWYRVRAKDGSGNTSLNPTEGMSVTTSPSNVNEGGYLYSSLTPTHDSWVNSTSTTQNNGTSTLVETLGNGSASTRIGLLRFDLQEMLGAIQSAVLSLYVRNGTTTTISVQVDNVTFDEATVTYANQPTVAGTTLTFTAPTASQYVSVDLGSLFIDGATTYTVKIFHISADNFTFDSKEGTFPPILEIESDPSNATQVTEVFTVEDSSALVTNYIKNPSFEDASTTSWTAPVAGTTLSNINTDAYSGLRSLSVVNSGASAAQGIVYTISEIVAVAGEWWTAGVSVKSVSGATALRLRLLEYTSGGSLLTETSINITASTTRWLRFNVSRLLTNASTARVTMRVDNAAATAATFRIDAASLTRTQLPVAYFDGDTSGAAWTGTVKASTSTMETGIFSFSSNYIGDSDNDNSVVSFFRRSNTERWISWTPADALTVHNRGIKRVTSYIGPMYGIYNYVMNPSFEVDVANWVFFNPSGLGTFTQTTDTADSGGGSGELVVTTTAGHAITSNRAPAAAGELWNAQARVYLPAGVTATLRIRALTAADVFIAETTLEAGIGSVTGADGWYTLYGLHTMPATTGLADVTIAVTSTIAGTVYVDSVYLGKNATALHFNPYVDGDSPDGVWEGTPHNSFTSLRVLPEQTYDVLHRYTDPDGLLDATVDLFYDATSSHVTAAVPDNLTTTQGVVFTDVTSNSARLSFAYLGDDNDNMTVVIEWKRADLANWASVTPIYDRMNKLIITDIENLKAGTAYNTRVTVTDADGIYNTNPILTNVTTSTDENSPETDPTVMFGGFLLTGSPDGKIGVISHDAFGLPERRVQIENLPRTDGAIELQNLWGQRTISMQGYVEGDSRADLEDAKNALKRALAPKLQRLVIDTLANQRRYYTATCESLLIAEVGGENLRHLLWDAEFVCADPFAYDSVLSVMPEFSVTNGGTVTVNNLGDLRTDPYIKIRTTHSKAVSLVLVNNTTGERITPNTTIINGDRLVIDTQKMALYKNGVEVDYAGGFPHLVPESNQFAFTVTATSGTPSLLVGFQWRHKFL